MTTCSKLASSNRVKLAFAEELICGVINDPIALQEINYTGEGLNITTTATQSETIRADRQIADLIRTSRGAAGNFGFEFQMNAYDLLLEGAFQDVFTVDKAELLAESVSVVNAGTDPGSLTFINGAFTAADVGSWIHLAGFTAPTNNGWHRIQVVPDVNNIKVDSTDMVTETTAITFGATEKLQNGIIAKSFTIEKFAADSATPTYFWYLGMEVAQWSIDMPLNGVVTGDFAFMGQDGDVGEAELPNATYTPPVVEPILNTVESITELMIDGVHDDLVAIQSLSFSVNNGSRAQMVLGQEIAAGIASDTSTITGSITMYFRDKSFYQKLLDDTPFSISIVMTDIDGASKVIEIMRAKLADMTINAGSINTDFIATGNFQGTIDPVTGKTIQMTRLEAA